MSFEAAVHAQAIGVGPALAWKCAPRRAAGHPSSAMSISHMVTAADVPQHALEP